VQLHGVDWEHLLYIGLTDGRKVDAGLEYARGSRVRPDEEDEREPHRVSRWLL
jgi:hypothetical protein